MLSPRLSIGSILVASLLFVSSDCTLRTEFANPFDSLPAEVLSSVADCLSNRVGLRASCKLLRKELPPGDITHFTREGSLWYIQDEDFRNSQNALLLDPRTEIRLNLGEDFKQYMLDEEFRGVVDALVENPLLQVWSDVRVLDFEKARNVPDFTPLLRLVHLEELNVSYTNMQSISILGGLQNLRKLDLSYTAVGDIRPLGELTKLEVLDLTRTNVNNIGPLERVTSLKELTLRETAVRNIKPLAGMPNLQVLDVSGTQVEDLSVANLLPALLTLDVRYVPNARESVMRFNSRVVTLLVFIDGR